MVPLGCSRLSSLGVSFDASLFSSEVLLSGNFVGTDPKQKLAKNQS